MLWNVPIESLKERYSADWNKWFPDYFLSKNISFIPIDGKPLTDGIQVGQFLDCIGTNYYKATQLQEICAHFFNRHVKDGDVFLFHDAWFPGIEMLAYLRDSLGIKFKIVGIFHAGTWDPFDFLTQKGMQFWARPLEDSWMYLLDKIVVATSFHKELLVAKRFVQPDKIHVTGLPIYMHTKPCFVSECPERSNTIVFPHRLAPEKDPDMFNKLRHVCSKIDVFKDYDFIKTKDVTATKSEYYSLLEDSKVSVSCAKQETFGYAMIESVMSGCLPLVPDRLSYAELYPKCFRYCSFEDLVSRLTLMVTQPSFFKEAFDELQTSLMRTGTYAIQRITDLCLT
jgi:glycosyltransferase involved in cell wall biosynthesis